MPPCALPFHTFGLYARDTKIMTAIVLTPDEYYLPYACCAVAQIARFGRQADSVLVVVPTSTHEQHLNDLVATASQYKVPLHVIRLPPSESQRLTEFKPFSFGAAASYATYIRLLLPELLPDYDEVLYLDVDVLIRAPLDNLLQWNLHHPLGAVPELVGTGEHIFGTPQTAYFNAGVMRMSLARMRELRLWDQAQEILRTRNDLRWFDQDVLNIIFEGQFDSLPLSCNVSDMLIRMDLRLPLFEEPAVVHFNGPKKPWQPAVASRFAREWRQIYAAIGSSVLTQHGTTSRERVSGGVLGSLWSTYAALCERGHGTIQSMMRVRLLARAKRMATRGLLAISGRFISHIERLQRGLDPAPLSRPARIVPANPHTIVPERRAPYRHKAESSHDDGLDLMISVARSGTNALGEVLQRSRSQLHWLNEFYLGAGWGNVHNDELEETLPWFAQRGPESLAALSSHQRLEAFRSFSAAVSDHALDLTKTILKNRNGRTLIKLFPGQLSSSALEDILRTFRPRLLFVRRELLYTHVSRLRATNRDATEKTFATSWINKDLTDTAFTIDERQASKHVAQCDHWYDSVECLADDLGLHRTWLTYSGLFLTGKDIPLLQDFYPGKSFATVQGSEGLMSTLKVQDRKTDASVLALLKAASGLSVATQEKLFRLPGSHGRSSDDGG